MFARPCKRGITGPVRHRVSDPCRVGLYAQIRPVCCLTFSITVKDNDIFASI